MPCGTKSCPSHRKHTPIVSEKQKGLFGAAYGAKKAGKPMPSYVPKSLAGESSGVLKAHLKEAKGKSLPPTRGKVGKGDWGPMEKKSAGGSQTVVEKSEMMKGSPEFQKPPMNVGAMTEIAKPNEQDQARPYEKELKKEGKIK
jgi:hypothetical protein